MNYSFQIIIKPLREIYPLNICLVFFCCYLLSGCQPNKKEEYVEVKKHYAQAGFAGSKSCSACHQDEYQTWKGSMHDLAMKVADSTTVLGNFNDVSFKHKAVITQFFKKGKKYFVNTEGPDGNYHDYEVVYTFGVYPPQQYLVKFPKGQFQALLSAWDSEKKNWFSLEQELEVQHEDWLHWTGGSMRWNTMCADCHSTNLEKNFDPDSGEYHTTFSEINVGCEACHGPAEEHVFYYEKKLEGAGAPPELYMDSNMGSREVVEKCARCHSRRSQLTEKFDYKGHFLDHYDPELLVYPTYEYDGQIKDEDYVYGSFLQSKMYHSGISCIDCHDVHNTKTREVGNDLCLRCHENTFSTPSHTMHKKRSDAALCINCHMTGKTYMGNDFRRDHSFRIPRPDQTVLYGTPNACNSCHTDRSAEWASKKIAENFEGDRPDHFSDLLIPGQLGDRAALKELIRDQNYPDISRSTAVRLLATGSLAPQDVVFLQQYQKDKSPMIRNEVVKALSHYQTPGLAGYINELLSDSIRLIRINAARASVMNQLPILDSLAYSQAKNEYYKYLDMNADFPSGQHELALFYEISGEIGKAIDAYQKALDIDSYNNLSRMNLALLQYQNGNVKEAEQLYLKVVEQESQFAEAYYMLGLLYNETGNPKKALEYLSKSCGLEVPFVRACYNYALLLQQNEEFQESIEVLNGALKKFPEEESLLYVKLIAEINLGAESNARATLDRLLKIAPTNPQYQEIKRRMK